MAAATPSSRPAPAPAPASASAAVPRPRTVLLEVLLLTAATCLLYRDEFTSFVRESAGDPMRSTLIILPLLLAMWTWRRRRDLAADIRPARIAGAALWTLGLIVHAASAWPFPVFQFRVWAMVPMLGGIVLWAGGWRVLRATVPMLGVVALALPIGARVLGQLTGPVESLVLRASVLVLDRLPGHAARLESIDLVVETASGAAAVVGLGAPHRAVGGLLPMLALGLVIMFARRRSLAAMVLGLGAVPVIAVSACLLRLLTWSVLAVRAGGDPLVDAPRLIGTVAAFLWLWIATAAIGWILGLMLPVRDPASAATPAMEHAR